MSMTQDDYSKQLFKNLIKSCKEALNYNATIIPRTKTSHSKKRRPLSQPSIDPSTSLTPPFSSFPPKPRANSKQQRRKPQVTLVGPALIRKRIERYPKREWKFPHDGLTIRQREEKRRKMLYRIPTGETEFFDFKEEAAKTSRRNQELGYYNEILRNYKKIKNLMDYENELKNQADLIETEEKRILLMHKNPKLARKKFAKKQLLENIDLKKRAKKEVMHKFKSIKKKYNSSQNKNQKYIFKKMQEEMDLTLNYKVIKAKLEAKCRRDGMRELAKTKEIVKQKLIQEMKDQRATTR
ncbi:unnamed protein product [Moneuplotes crassus]|uniref:Uncharacterized protein n=1 Tax=Euplotes crassus TaxID=5936 RepID=A0AAD1XB88_EUPCR|nr:unnamed protein product [Moneuplotes crassus]